VCSSDLGAKEVGEGSIAGMLAAIANAVHDAVGVRVKSLPITPEKILMAQDESNADSR
jgi:CO/xanthine dehydrogenase Mo-binding subunit